MVVRFHPWQVQRRPTHHSSSSIIITVATILPIIVALTTPCLQHRKQCVPIQRSIIHCQQNQLLVIWSAMQMENQLRNMKSPTCDCVELTFPTSENSFTGSLVTHVFQCCIAETLHIGTGITLTLGVLLLTL